MANRPKNPKDEYKQMRAVWYKKLKDEGFEDIESDDQNLKIWSAKFTRNAHKEVWQAKEAYYSMATHLLNDFQFANKFERLVWEYHTEGVSIRDIVKIVNKYKRSDKNKVDRNVVWGVVRKLEQIMKAMYLPSQSGNT